MSYQDPNDPRTRRYETGYQGNARAYNEVPQSGYYQDPAYAQDPTYAQQPPAYAQQPPQPARKRLGPDINPGMYASGVAMTGVVTGIAAWLVAWIIRTVVQRINENGSLGIWNPVARDEIWFALVAFLCALAAGALWYVLQISTPAPNQFFRWIVGLLITASVVVPLLLSAEFSVGLGTAIMHLVIGLPILALIPAMGEKSLRRRR